MTEPRIGVPVGLVDKDPLKSLRCYCYLEEMMDGHRHHCPDHIICNDCIEDWKND